MRRIPVDPASVHRGLVETYSRDEGIGVITSAATPGGCWVIFSFLRDTFELHVGQAVWFTFEEADQDGFDYRALDVWTNPDLIGQETNVPLRLTSINIVHTVIPDDDPVD